MNSDEFHIFSMACQQFKEEVSLITPIDWEKPGLGNWDVKSLVGHAFRALTTLENYLEGTAPSSKTLKNAASYFIIANLSDPKVNEGIEKRGIESAQMLGDDPISKIEESISKVDSLLLSVDSHTLLNTPFGAMDILDYLDTRSFELVVHSLDISKVISRSIKFKTELLNFVWKLLGEIAIEKGICEDLLLNITGREVALQSIF